MDVGIFRRVSVETGQVIICEIDEARVPELSATTSPVSEWVQGRRRRISRRYCSGIIHRYARHVGPRCCRYATNRNYCAYCETRPQLRMLEKRSRLQLS
jgi:hypothetical protein